MQLGTNKNNAIKQWEEWIMHQLLKAAGRCCLAIAAVLTVSTAGATAKEATLQLWVTGSEYAEILPKQISKFEAANPGVKVDLTMMDWGTYRQQILTGIAGGTPPDVVTFWTSDLATFASQGLLRSIDKDVNKQEWQQGGLQAMSLDGTLYALPWGLALRALNYRTDFLSEVGLQGPPVNWKDLREYAIKLTKHGANGDFQRVGFWIPTGHSYKTPSIWLAFLWGNGGELLSPDGKKAVFNGPEGVEATEFLAGLLRDDKVDTPGAITEDITDFIQGKVAMLLSNGISGVLDSKAPDLVSKVKLAMPPYNKKPVVELAAEGVGVTSNSKNPDEAVKLALFLTSNVEALIAHDAANAYMPAYKAALDSDYVKKSPWLRQYAEMAQYARPLPVHPRYIEIEAILKDALDSVYVGGVPAKQALDAAAEQVDALLQ